MPRIKMKKAKEGKMSKRKNLNDAIYGDRAAIRGYANPKPAAWESHFNEAEPVKKAAGAYDFEDWRKGAKHSSGGGSHHSHESCHVSHRPMRLPGTEFVIHGGSCINPKVTDADVYIGFDSGMKLTKNVFPWNGGTDVFFRINDMAAPSDAGEFRKLVEWTMGQLKHGKKVHAGCIGGHGRTGTFFAALVSMYGEPDAVGYVRTNYCHKAVESSAQVAFLQKHYKVKDASGAKESKHSGGNAKSGAVTVSDGSAIKVTPIMGNGCIWDAP